MLDKVIKSTRRRTKKTAVVNTLLPPGYNKLQGVKAICTGCKSFITTGVLGKGKFICLHCWDSIGKPSVDN